MQPHYINFYSHIYVSFDFCNKHIVLIIFKYADKYIFFNLNSYINNFYILSGNLIFGNQIFNYYTTIS